MDPKISSFSGPLMPPGKNPFSALPELNSLSDILDDVCSPSLKPSNKISIPMRSYDSKKLESLNVVEKPVQSFKHAAPKETFDKPEDLWGEVGEEMKFAKSTENYKDQWEVKVTEETRNNEEPKNWADISVSSEKSNQDKRIKIPGNPYKQKNPENAPKLEEHVESFKRGKRSRGRYNNFRTAPENIETHIVPVPNPRAEQVKVFSPEKVESWPNFSIEPSNQVSEEFNLKTYKTQKCPNGEKCKGCNRYHYEGEKRRDFNKIQYSATLCQRAQNCMMQERCGKAHNFIELYYHPQIFRSLPCPYAIKCKQCSFGSLCNFIHLVDDKNAENKPKVKCKGCNQDDVCMVRVKCGHACCKNCAGGNECKRCRMPGETIKLEL